MKNVSLCRITWPVACGFLLLFFLGCGQSADDRPPVEITGTVTLDGKPLMTGVIQFTSSQTGESAYSPLDAAGNYWLEFPNADVGAEYAVTISPPIDESGDALAAAENPAARQSSPIPRKYRDRTTSGLSVTIQQPGLNTFDFQLSSR